MALPAHRTTSSKRDMRRSHHALAVKKLSKCAKCSSFVLSHRACSNCGYYKGREVIDVLAKLDKKERKQKEKELAQEQKEDQK